MKGKISKSGYKSNSPDKNNDFNIIPGGHITMKTVPHDVLGIDNMGNFMIMKPGGQYKFPGNSVLEIPMKKGGEFSDKVSKLMHEGYPQKQALAIAFSMQRRGELEQGGEDIPYFLNNSVYQGGGTYVPPSGATKVTQVPSDFTYSGEAAGKKYYVKSIAAPGAIASTSAAGSFDAEKHKQFLIAQLQSGVKPEDLVKAGHATSSGIKPLLPFYKKAAVYIEEPGTVTPKKMSFPLQESDRLEMKQIFPPSGGKYTTFQLPDPEAGYTKATEVYYDPTTYRQIDPLKSFDPSGSYSPSYLYSDPTKGTLAEKYRGTKVATRQDVSKIGVTDTLNPNPVRAGTLGAGFQMGGGVLDQKSFSDFFSQYFDKKKSTNVAPQGQNTEQYVAKKREEFLEHLRSNVMKNFVMKEMGNFLKYGGMPKAQFGDQVGWQDPQDSTMGVVPDFVKQIQAMNSPISFQPEGESFRSDLNLDPMRNIGLATEEDALREVERKNRRSLGLSTAADSAVMGMNLFSNMIEQKRALELEKKQRAKAGQDFFKTVLGSRGDYDINSGVFRPDQMTPTSYYKKGGQYLGNDKEIARLKALGYEIEIIE